MKKAFLLILTAAMLACLTGCRSKTPAIAADGTPWSREWTSLGPTMGLEDPGHDMTLRDSKTAKNMYYTAWSIGEAQPYVNSSGSETNLYDAQLVFLLTSARSEEDAQISVEDLIGLAQERYTITDTVQQTCNGQEFTILAYTFPSDTSPFARGASAFAAFDTWSLSVEFVCQDSFEGDALEIMTDVLNHCHYAAKS